MGMERGAETGTEMEGTETGMGPETQGTATATEMGMRREARAQARMMKGAAAPARRAPVRHGRRLCS